MINRLNRHLTSWNKQKQPKKRAVIIRLFSAFKRYGDRRRRRKEEIKSEHQLNEQIMAHWTRRVGLFTAALVLVGIATAIIFGCQLGVMQGQLEEMANEQRPWVYSDTPTAQSGVTRNPAGWYQLDLNFTLHNVGHLPARFAYIIPMSAVLSDVSDIASRVSKLCRAGVGPDFVGVTIFPGQEFNYTPTLGISPTEIADARANSSNINYVVYGCAIYQFPTGAKQHASGFAYLLGLKKGQGQRTIADPLPADIEHVSLNDLVLIPWISQTSFDAY